ncbi:MAG: carbon-nitrogen hydrolase family protein [Pseudomonadota bacterium]
MKVATIQFESLDGEFDINLERAKTLLEQASQQGADIALLPEFSLIGYMLSFEVWQHAELFNGRTVQEFSGLAKSLAMYIGTSFLEADGDDFYNTFFLAGPTGEITGIVRKQTPANAEGYFFRGEANEHFIDTSLGRIGIGICQENYRCFLPELMHRNNVDIMLMPYSYPDMSKAGGIPSPKGSFVAAWYARQLGVPVVTSNKTGPWPQVKGAYFPGASAIVDTDGTALGELSNVPGMLMIGIELDEHKKRAPVVRCVGPYIKDLTLGSWFKRRLTWGSIWFAKLIGKDPDDVIHQHYLNNKKRTQIARQLAQN